MRIGADYYPEHWEKKERWKNRCRDDGQSKYQSNQNW